MTTETTETTQTNETSKPLTIEEINKKISRTIRFKDHMLYMNDQLKTGKTEAEIEMSAFEADLRAKEGNFKWFKLENGKFVKLFSWDLVQRSIDKIKELREQKAQLTETVPA